MKQNTKIRKKRIVRPLPSNPYIPTRAEFQALREEIRKS